MVWDQRDNFVARRGWTLSKATFCGQEVIFPGYSQTCLGSFPGLVKGVNRLDGDAVTFFRLHIAIGLVERAQGRLVSLVNMVYWPQSVSVFNRCLTSSDRISLAHRIAFLSRFTCLKLALKTFSGTGAQFFRLALIENRCFTTAAHSHHQLDLVAAIFIPRAWDCRIVANMIVLDDFVVHFGGLNLNTLQIRLFLKGTHW